MTKKLTFAIGVPTYNQASYLRETLLSILNQDEAPDRIVVSNNHSTDETAEILAEFEDRIEVVMPPQHLSAMENWNYVASHLREDWFSLLSSDDIAYRNFTQVLKRGISKSEEAVLVRAAWDNIDEKGKLIGHHYLLTVGAVTKPPKTLLENRQGPKAGFAAFAIHRETWQKVGGFSTAAPIYRRLGNVD